MSSKFATIGALCGGGITIGAVATVSVMLLTSGSALQEMSDMEALEKGFSQMFESQETSEYLQILENLEGKPLSTYADVKINNIYDMDELIGTNFGYTLDTDATDLLLTVYGDAIDLPFEGTLSGSIFLSPEMLAITSNAISNYIAINLDSFIEDYNASTLATLTGPIDLSMLAEQGIDLSMFDKLGKLDESFFSSINTTELEKNLKAQFKEDMEILIDNIKTTRSEDSTTVNGFETYKITATVETTYLSKLFYNQIIEFFADSTVQETINDFYAEYVALLFNLDPSRNVAAELSAAISLAYGEVEEEIIETIGNTFKLNVYMSEDLKICRITLPLSFNDVIPAEDTEDGVEVVKTETITFEVNFYGNNNIYSEYALSITASNSDSEKEYVEYSKRIKDGSTVYTYFITENDVEEAKITLTNTTTDDTFINTIKVYASGIELGTANINGTYKFTDNSIEINASKITIDAASLPILDMSLKFGIKENTEDVSIPSEKTLILTDMTIDEIAAVFEELGLFFGKPGLGEEFKEEFGNEI